VGSSPLEEYLCSPGVLFLGPASVVGRSREEGKEGGKGRDYGRPEASATRS